MAEWHVQLQWTVESHQVSLWSDGCMFRFQIQGESEPESQFTVPSWLIEDPRKAMRLWRQCSDGIDQYLHQYDQGSLQEAIWDCVPLWNGACHLDGDVVDSVFFGSSMRGWWCLPTMPVVSEMDSACHEYRTLLWIQRIPAPILKDRVTAIGYTRDCTCTIGMTLERRSFYDVSKVLTDQQWTVGLIVVDHATEHYQCQHAVGHAMVVCEGIEHGKQFLEYYHITTQGRSRMSARVEVRTRWVSGETMSHLWERPKGQVQTMRGNVRKQMGHRRWIVMGSHILMPCMFYTMNLVVVHLCRLTQVDGHPNAAKWALGIYGIHMGMFQPISFRFMDCLGWSERVLEQCQIQIDVSKFLTPRHAIRAIQQPRRWWYQILNIHWNEGLVYAIGSIVYEWFRS